MRITTGRLMAAPALLVGLALLVLAVKCGMIQELGATAREAPPTTTTTAKAGLIPPLALIKDDQGHIVDVSDQAGQVHAQSAGDAAVDPCGDYDDLEKGEGSTPRQDWFNHLDARGYARFRVSCVYHWDDTQYRCLDTLWTEESRWNHHADGPNGPAGNTAGIPQAYPDTKMASAGSDWRWNPRTQVRWGLGYIAERYRVPTNTPHRCHAGY